MSARRLLAPSVRHAFVAALAFVGAPVFVSRQRGIVCKPGASCPEWSDEPTSLLAMLGGWPAEPIPLWGPLIVTASLSLVLAFVLVALVRSVPADSWRRSGAWLRPTRATWFAFAWCIIALPQLFFRYAAGRAGGVGALGEPGVSVYSVANWGAWLALPFLGAAWLAIVGAHALVVAYAVWSRALWLVPTPASPRTVPSICRLAGSSSRSLCSSA